MGTGLQSPPLSSELPEKLILRSSFSITVADGSRRWAPVGVYLDHELLIFNR